jgi:site-specific DNA-methyltransferase (adenine-specific)
MEAAELLGGESLVRLWQGDYLELLPRVADTSVDLVLCDLPYGVTDCRWDRRIEAGRLWREYVRVLKARGVVALFAQCPFCAELMQSAPRGWLRYEWAWDKCAPMRRHEAVLIFGRNIRYRPQGLTRITPKRRSGRTCEVYGAAARASVQRYTGYPTTLLRFGREKGARPAQKPVALLEYLIRTYTRRGGLVLDNAMGLGSTGVAAVRSGRRFVGIEIDSERFAEARRRMEVASE